MKHYRQAIILAVSVLATIAVCLSCRDNKDDGESTQRWRELAQDWNRFSSEGKYDSLIDMTRPYLRQYILDNDTASILYSAVYIAQSFQQTEEPDSAKRYLDLINRYNKSTDPRLNVVICNILGAYCLKYELDYSGALKQYFQGYQYTKEYGDINNGTALLANIVNIFYIRGDKTGMKYALKALGNIGNPLISDFTRALVYISMAQMHYLDGNLNEAETYLTDAADITGNNRFTSLESIVALLRADIEHDRGHLHKAVSCYEKALASSAYAESGIESLIYLNYGRTIEQLGDTGHALRLYKKGVEVSEKTGNKEFRLELLSRISILYDKSGDIGNYIRYSAAFIRESKTIRQNKKEQELSNLLLSYQEIEHSYIVQSQELALLKANRKTDLFIFIAVACLLLLAISIIIYRKKQKTYLALVAQHRHYMNRINLEKKEKSEEYKDSGSDETDRLKELFSQLERLMNDEKVYRSNDLSLEKLSDITGSNRTYVSKAIGMFANMSFHNYVNMYRINEATAIFSDPQDKTPLKKICSDLGFNSISVFYKAFQKETGLTPNQYRMTVSKNRKILSDSTN